MNQLLDASAKGVYTIAATPFTDTGDIDWPSVDSLVEFYFAMWRAGADHSRDDGRSAKTQ
jgi:hypothetical protein